jgi:hypothetical protein
MRRSSRRGTACASASTPPRPFWSFWAVPVQEVLVPTRGNPSAGHTAGVWDAATAKELTVLREPAPRREFRRLQPRRIHIVTASDDKTAPVWDTRFATMSTKDLFDEPSERCLLGLTKLTRDAARRLSQGYARD